MIRTAEFVSPGHPDKVCDQISDKILDICLEQDSESRVAIETAGGHGSVHLTGEITTNAELDYESIVKEGSGIEMVTHNIVKQSNFITVHVPKQKKPLINKKELQQMKKGSFIINTSRGGVINESDLLNELNSRHIVCAALDVYEYEPNPKLEVLMNDYLSLSPHIGASTLEAQERIGVELAKQINALLND